MKLEVEAKPVTTIRYFVEIEGKTYDAEDLMEDLSAIAQGDVRLPPTPHGKMLMNVGALQSLGSRDIAATKGPNFHAFRAALEEAMTEAGYE